MGAADAVLEDRGQTRGAQDHCHSAPVHWPTSHHGLDSLLRPNPGTLQFTNIPAPRPALLWPCPRLGRPLYINLTRLCLWEWCLSRKSSSDVFHWEHFPWPSDKMELSLLCTPPRRQLPRFRHRGLAAEPLAAWTGVEVGALLTSLVLTRPNTGQSSVLAGWLQKDYPGPLWASPAPGGLTPTAARHHQCCREMLSCTKPTTQVGSVPLPEQIRPWKNKRALWASRACTETECLSSTSFLEPWTFFLWGDQRKGGLLRNVFKAGLGF